MFGKDARPDYLEPADRKRASKKLVGELLKRQKGTCAHCPKVLAKINNGMVFICAAFEIDHVVPANFGGASTADNLQCLCPPCHAKKTLVDNRAAKKSARLRGEKGQRARREKFGSKLKGRPLKTPEGFKHKWPKREWK